MNHEISIEPGIFFGQMAYVLCGLFLMLLGAAIFYTIAQWRLHGQRIEASILGVRRRGPQYHSVYQYVLPGGALQQATSVQGSSSLKGRETGSRVAIRVMPGHPDEAREAPGFVMWSLAFGLFLGGAWLTYDSVSWWKRSPITWGVLALCAFFVGRKVWRWLARFLTNMKSQFGAQEPWSTIPVENAETLGMAPQPAGLRVRGAKPARSSAIFCVVGLISFAIAYIPAHKLLLLRAGTKADGTIVRLDVSKRVNNHYSIFPQVQFTGADGATMNFWDREGANPSPYKVGDHVTVLYQPGKQDSAMIDHGLRNWEPVAALLILGTVLVGLGLLTLRGLYASGVGNQVSRPYQA